MIITTPLEALEALLFSVYTGDKFRYPWGDLRPGAAVMHARPEIKELLRKLKSSQLQNMRFDACWQTRGK